MNIRKLLLMATLVTAAATAGAQTALRRAQDAYAAGDSDTAIAAYEEHLREYPNDIPALILSAKLLSWDEQYERAITRYDHVLELDPDNLTALMERAKVLSWSKRFDEAQQGFRRVLEIDPNNRDARIGLARTLSWSGQQTAARAEYEKILRVDEQDPEATVGVAQTWAWSGDRITARRWYERALEIEPGILGSKLGLAYLELGEGNLRAARPMAADLQQQYPNNNDVAQLAEAVDRADDPWYRLSREHVDDTEQNELDITGVEVGWALPSRMRVTLGFVRYDMDAPGRSGHIDQPRATLLIMPSPRDRIMLRGGADLVDTSDGREETEIIGGISWVRELSAEWRLALAVDHDSYRYSVPILDNLIARTDFGVRITGEPRNRWRTTLRIGGADFSDENDLTSADVGLWYTLPIESFKLEVGYVGRYLDYSRDLDNGYFDPEDFYAHIAQLNSRGNFGASRAFWDVRLEAGRQSFTLSGREVDDDKLFGWLLTLGTPLGNEASLEVYGGETDYALNSATGFESEQYGVRFRWQP